MIREVDSTDLAEAIALVNRVFSEFVAPEYGQQGRETFENYLKVKDQELARDMESGHKKMWACYRDGQIVGVISIREPAHISLLFVHKQHQHQGIAKQLFQVALEDTLQRRPDTDKITVNSSPYAVDAYAHLGFIQTGDQQEADGIIFTPMMRPITDSTGVYSKKEN